MRTHRVFGLVVVVGCLAIAACGGGSKKVNLPTNSDLQSELSKLSDFGNQLSSDTDFGTSSRTVVDTADLPVKARVVNAYTDKDGNPTDIDVWSTSGPQGGVKLATVAYGKASDYFTVKHSKNDEGQTESGTTVYSYSFYVYVKDKTDSDSSIINQSEDAHDGDVVTMVVGPSSTGFGGSDNVIFEKVGSNAGDNYLPTFGNTSAGSNVLLVPDAIGTFNKSSSSSDTNTSYTVGANGTCLPELDLESSEASTSSFLDIPAGNGASFGYLAAPGSSAQLFLAGNIANPCAATALTTFTVDGSAGDHAILVLYGDETAPKTLVLKAQK